jgi:hypothetical protein
MELYSPASTAIAVCIGAILKDEGGETGMRSYVLDMQAGNAINTL